VCTTQTVCALSDIVALRAYCMFAEPSVQLGQNTYTLTPKQYVLNVENTVCLFGFVGIDIPAPAGNVTVPLCSA
jgi:hypothetical protein